MIAVEEAAGERPAPARTYADDEPIPEDARDVLARLVTEARAEVAAVADDLGLERQPESRVRSLLGHVHVRVVTAAELSPRYLRSGGEVPPELADYIAPRARRLESALLSIAAVLERCRRDRGPAGGEE